MKYSTSNPAFSDRVWKCIQASTGGALPYSGTATINGTINKTLILLACILLTSTVSWSMGPQFMMSGLIFPVVLIASIAQLVIALVIVRFPVRAKSLGIAYALMEGLMLGGLSYIFELRFPGIVIQSVIGTAGVVCGMLIIYRANLIKVTENFKIMVASATFGIMFVYVISMIVPLFGVQMPIVNSNGTYGIVFSVFVIGIAALNLVMDFDFIEKCEEGRAPSYMEWYGAFGLMVTIVWLYIEILRLLSKLSSQN